VSYDFYTTSYNEQAVGVTGASFKEIPVAAAKGTGLPVVQFSCKNQTLSSELNAKEVLIKRDGDCKSQTTIIVHYTVNAITQMPEDAAARGTLYDTAGNTLTRWSVSRRVSRSSLGRPTTALNKGMSRIGPGTSVIESIKTYGKFELGPKEFLKPLMVNVPAAEDPVIGFMVSMTRIEEQGGDEETAGPVSMGVISCTEVEIGRAEVNGTLAFAFDNLLIEGTESKQKMEIMVQRLGGCSGTVSCIYRTERLTAVPGHDYEETDGELEFPEGVTEQFIEIEILPKGKHEHEDSFLVMLEHPEGGATFRAGQDGEDTEICTVNISALKLTRDTRVGRFLRSMDAAVNFDALRLGNAEWKEAFTAAIYCNGSPEEQAEAAPSDWVFHIIAVPWKVLFALIPPTAYLGGWPCFFASLFFIGLCTAFIGDLAELFGCVLDVNDTLTAIVFVALGTSMPDLFASKAAATQDPFADASIVNVTGSNSVNVFLGLGLPWTIGAIYWTIRGRTDYWEQQILQVVDADTLSGLATDEARFIAPAKGLVFSVVVFSVGAIIALGILTLRRWTVGAELGGPRKPKAVSFVTFIFLWCCDVGLVSWYTTRWDKASATEKVGVIAGSSGGVLFLVLLTALLAYKTKKKGSAEHEDEAATLPEGRFSEALPPKTSHWREPEPDRTCSDTFAPDPVSNTLGGSNDSQDAFRASV